MKVAEIELIIKEVTDKILKKIDSFPSATTKPAVAIIRQVGEYPQEKIAEIEKAVQWVRPEEQSAQALLVNVLSLSQLVAVANLQTIDYLTGAIKRFLFKGKPVWILACEVDRQQLKQQARFGVFKRYDEFCQQVESYGVTFDCNLEEIAKLQHNLKKKLITKEIKPGTSYVTEKMLMQQLKNSDTFVLTAQQRLTPLAEDYLREKNIKLVKE
ncbi:ethanolamine utilization protein [Enterococcus sp. PF1-24]|uniref:ethanolamine utilization protein n=1 Tax=unclassified Enterococcus TaxID=2608891 RepID=UPI002474DFA2|nr:MULTISPECIES: ethanolamine utilization protein [unclassified Enterococcus]MDH6363321.1 ethanolamine utilization protein [Enterococcus sp. PFB1-1]MDH6400378.1 ethanolamine utilization protein [Enterococcus sp. PF1-24]